ncbi:MAG TPA: ATP-binding protein [Ilumatobacteraceae bacterium]|nr:ATP-binding protein [Ilumatobacteraceae bacterium]
MVVRGGPDAELRFGPDPREVRRARALAEGLTPCRVSDERRADLLVVVSELVTNAIRHTRSGGVVRLWLDDHSVRVEVDDSAPRLSPASTTVDQHGGRGLALVARLSTTWGVDLNATGKTVWAVCPLDTGADPGGAAR